MAVDDDAVDRSESEQRRFRSFVARPPASAPETGSVVVSGADDDIPVLTEIVDAEILSHRHRETLLAALRADIENEVSAWLVDVLPAAVANASQQILDELDSKTRSTLLPRLQALIEARRESTE